ncbi:MAG: hypothetical protein MZV65_22505 [Chromatiales bacterium]|nr:hypothetical protein [Chromatiales bacterium]
MVVKVVNIMETWSLRPWSRIGIPRALRQIFDSYTAIYAVTLSITAILALLFAIVRPLHEAYGMAPILFLSTVSIVLILIGEIQSRYIFFAWYILPIMIALSVNSLSTRKISLTDLVQGVRCLIAPSLLLVLFLTAFLLWSRFGYGDSQGRIFSASEFVDASAISVADRWSITADLATSSDRIEIYDSQISLEIGMEYELVFLARASRRTAKDVAPC